MAKQSLVGKQSAVVESNPGSTSLSIFEPQNNPAANVAEVAAPLFAATGYVAFVSSKGPTYAKMLQHIPDLEDSDPVLIQPEPNPPMRLAPFRFYLISAKTHFSVVDSEGGIVRTTFDREKARADRDFLEHVETVLLAVVGNRLYPVRCTFKTTKTNAIHSAVKTLEQASGPQWATLSPEHKESLIATDPRFRFTTTVYLKRGTGKSSGFKYAAASGVPKPTTAADWRMVGEFFADEKNVKACGEVVESFNRRFAELQTKVV